MKTRARTQKPIIIDAGSDADVEPDFDPKGEELEVEEAYEQVKARPSKKQKTNGGRSKAPINRTKVQGRLELISEMPLDLLNDVLSYLEPVDILRLSRTNKWFRNLLLNKRQAFIWAEAAKNIPMLPEPPLELSMPAWISLLFERKCEHCGRLTSKVDIQLRHRVCVPCGKRIIFDNAHPDYANLDDPGLTNWYYRNDLAKSMIHRGEPFLGSRWAHINNYAQFYYYRPEFDQAMELIKDFGKEHKTIEAYVNANPKIREIREKQDSVRAESVKHTLLCNDFFENKKETTAANNAGASMRRRRAIEAKLIAKGYNVETLPPEVWSDKSVSQAKDLTERIWSNIEPKLDQLIPTYILRRRNETRFARISQDTNQWRFTNPFLFLAEEEPTAVEEEVLDKNEFNPPVPMANIVKFPSYAALMAQEEEPTEEQWTSARANLYAEAEEWRKGVRADLLALVPDSIKSMHGKGDISPLLRADVVFKAKEAAIGLSPKNALDSHLFNVHPDENVNRKLTGKFWTGDTSGLEFAPEMSAVIRKAIEKTSISLKEATDEKLNAMTEKFGVKTGIHNFESFLTFRSLKNQAYMNMPIGELRLLTPEQIIDERRANMHFDYMSDSDDLMGYRDFHDFEIDDMLHEFMYY